MWMSRYGKKGYDLKRCQTMNRKQVDAALSLIPSWLVAEPYIKDGFIRAMKPLNYGTQEMQQGWWFYSRGFDDGYDHCAQQVKNFLS